jgi:hypothetical protein
MILETLNFCVALHRYQEDLDKSLSTTKPRQRTAVEMDGPEAQTLRAVEAILEAVPTTFFIIQELLNLSDSRSSLVSILLDTCLITLTFLSIVECGSCNLSHQSLSAPSHCDSADSLELFRHPSHIHAERKGST